MNALDREDVDRRAEPAQRRGPHRRLGDQVMHDPLRRESVERLAVAGAGARRAQAPRPPAAEAAGRAAPRRPAGCRRRPAGWCACRSRSRSSSRPGVAASSSVARTVTTIAGLTGSKPNSSSRRQRTRTGFPGFSIAIDRGVGGRVVGAVMAVAARPLHVLHRDRGGIELQGAGQRRAQRIDALAMRPHL